jgi:hypothetical protein
VVELVFFTDSLAGRADPLPVERNRGFLSVRLLALLPRAFPLLRLPAMSALSGESFLTTL